MSADEIQRIVLRLANQSWCRYWLNFGDKHDGVEMAIQCTDENGGIMVDELLSRGFKHVGNGLYTIFRTNNDGTPYVSKLF